MGGDTVLALFTGMEPAEERMRSAFEGPRPPLLREEEAVSDPNSVHAEEEDIRGGLGA